MMKNITKTIGIVGSGKVGTAMGFHAHRAGYRVTAIASRAKDSAIAASKIIAPNSKIAINPADMTGSDIVLLTVCDDSIASVCEKLAKQNFFAPGSTVAHCSGAFGLELLESSKDICHANIACLHPLQTFPTIDAGVATLADAFFVCQGLGQGLATIVTLAGDIGAGSCTISPTSQAKALYHASAVLACNYITSLIDASLTLAKAAGMDEDDAGVFWPLIQTTIDNVRKLSPAGALTGPISRADVKTVSMHIQALTNSAQDAKLIDLYRAAGQWTVELAQKNNSITPAQAEQIRNVLDTQTAPDSKETH